METVILIFVLLIGFAIFTIVKRAKNGSFVANDHMFSQSGIIVKFKEQTITIKNKPFSVNAITDIRTEPPLRGQTMAFDCVISLSDFNTPQHRVRFINSTQANKFMQRLTVAIEKAGGPRFQSY